MANDMNACKKSGRMIEVLPEVCSDRKVEEMRKFYVPRYGKEAFERTLLQSITCYNSEGL